MLSKRVCLLAIFFLTTFFSVLCAQNQQKDKVELKTGEVYIGDIIVQNEQLVIIKLTDGSRFQINTAEVQAISKTTASDGRKTSLDESSQLPLDSVGKDNLCGMLDLSGGGAFAPSAFDASPYFDISLSFGVKSIGHNSLFLGLGTGYYNVFTSGTSLGYIPVFARFSINKLSVKRTSPYFLLDAGYAFNADNKASYKGGLLAKFSAGIIHKLNSKTAFFAGPYIMVQSVSGKISETVNANAISYNGFTSLYAVGLKTGFQF